MAQLAAQSPPTPLRTCAVPLLFYLLKSRCATRLGDLLDFGQLFKAFSNNYFAQSPTFLGTLCKGVKIYHFSSEIIFGQLL